MKGKSTHPSLLEELCWGEVREEVLKHNPILAKIMDDLSPSSKYTLFKGSYPYGSEILKEGYLQIPNNEGSLISLNNSHVSSDLQLKLGYNGGTNPVSIVLKNSTEIFMILENHTIPLYGIITPGRIFSTWKVLNPLSSQSPAFLWNMTAGARSIFMLPKISESDKYKKLKKQFNLKSEVPRTLLDHWHIFREIASHSSLTSTWATEILFFSNKWFEHLEDKKWQPFKDYLYKNAWQGSEYWRNQFIWDLVFSLIQKERKIKPNPYISDTAKHLIGMAISALPGFSPAVDDSAAPIEQLQQVYTEVYKLEEYAPIIMQPNFLVSDPQRPIYYSLQYPTTIEFSPRRRERSSMIFELYEVKSLLSKYLMDMRLPKLNLAGTTIYELPDKVDFDFFHTDNEGWTGIRKSKEISIEDPFFSNVPKGMNKKFPYTNPFVRGCVRIKTKDASSS